MNPLLQPDVHPDAESLNAFVERALRQPERAQIVAHLGGCARCRDVVFLAQAAADADVSPGAAVEPESRPAQSGWPWWRTGFPDWRIALIPAAAIAAGAGLFIWVQMKSAPPAATVAQVTLPSASASPSLAASPVPRPEQAAAASAGPPVAVQHIQPKPARVDRRNSPSGTLAMNGPAPPPVAELKAPGGFDRDRNLASMARPAAAQEAAIAPPAPPSSSNAQWNGDFAGKAKMAERAQRPSIQAVAANPPPAPVPPNFAAVHGSLMAPVTTGPRPPSAEAAASRQIEVMPQPVNGLAALRLTSHPRLPSGLNAVSSAVMLDRILAVDPDGAVFLSRDAAKHWERVPNQWTGKAVAVQAPPRELYPMNAAAQNDEALHPSPVASVSIMPSPPAPAPAAQPPAEPSKATPTAESASPALPPPAADAAPAMPGMLFKLINDRHQTWISADGKVWREQVGWK